MKTFSRWPSARNPPRVIAETSATQHTRVVHSCAQWHQCYISRYHSPNNQWRYIKILLLRGISNWEPVHPIAESVTVTELCMLNITKRYVQYVERPSYATPSTIPLGTPGRLDAAPRWRWPAAGLPPRLLWQRAWPWASESSWEDENHTKKKIKMDQNGSKNGPVSKMTKKTDLDKETEKRLRPKSALESCEDTAVFSFHHNFRRNMWHPDM